MPFRFGQDKADGGLAVTKYIVKPSETEAFVPDGTAVVGSGAFRGCGGLRKVTLPNSVRRIMSYAFADCTGLREISLGGAEELCKGAFAGCRELRKVYLPDSVRAVHAEAFHGCTALTELRLPEKRPADLSGLDDCRSLRTLVIGEREFSVGGGAMKSGQRIPLFIYNCLEKSGYLLRRFYGFDIDESFLFGFACELYGYGHPDAAAFIEARYVDMLRCGVSTGHIGMVKLLLKLHGGAVTDELIDLAARSDNHEIYLMLAAERHGGGVKGERFGL